MGSKKIHMRKHPAVRGNDGWGCGGYEKGDGNRTDRG